MGGVSFVEAPSAAAEGSREDDAEAPSAANAEAPSVAAEAPSGEDDAESGCAAKIDARMDAFIFNEPD